MTATSTLSAVELLIQLAQTPAPTFAEEARAERVSELWAGFGLRPQRDAVGNVLARVAGTAGGRGPRLALAAHLDTVFPAETDLTVRREGHKLVGPGIGDNAASLTVLTLFAAQIAANPPPCEIWLVATVGEEGLGDLRGAKHFLGEHAGDLSHFVAVDGYLGLVVDQCVGVRRFEVTFRTAGGHSWGNAGAPSAIQALAEAVHELYGLVLPSEPRSSLNVGTIQGGTSVNSIAAEAKMLLDLRSLDALHLDQVEHNVRQLLQKAAKRGKAELGLVRVGSRPAGSSENLPLVRAAARALDAIGLSASRVASSTDANAAVPHHLSAIGLGVYKGGNAHRLDEWVESASLGLGLRLLEQFVRMVGR
jgi:tripeptide aminopeptidase